MHDGSLDVLEATVRGLASGIDSGENRIEPTVKIMNTVLGHRWRLFCLATCL